MKNYIILTPTQILYLLTKYSLPERNVSYLKGYEDLPNRYKKDKVSHVNHVLSCINKVCTSKVLIRYNKDAEFLRIYFFDIYILKVIILKVIIPKSILLDVFPKLLSVSDSSSFNLKKYYCPITSIS